MYILYSPTSHLMEQAFVAKLHTALQCMYVCIVVALCALNETIVYFTSNLLLSFYLSFPIICCVN